jgi:NAD-dependent deacetylase
MAAPSDAIAEAAALLSAAKSAVAFTGAGISTPSGIPDFRDPDGGLWSHFDPMEVASIYSFRHNPQSFYDWVYPLAAQIMAAQPNPAHTALAALEAHGVLKAVITQNIDMLHQRAGSTIYEIHGSLRQATCIHCFAEYPGEAVMRQFLADRALPRCEKCGAVLKPNIILFGEQLPFQVFQGASRAARKADVMLIVGSSLEVAPASDLPRMALNAGAKLVIVNLSPCDFDSAAQVVIHADAAEILPAIAQRVKGIAA